MQRLRQIVFHSVPYFIESAYNQMNPGTDYGSLLLTGCARKHVFPSDSSRLYPDNKSLFSKSCALDAGQTVVFILFLLAVRRTAF